MKKYAIRIVSVIVLTAFFAVLYTVAAEEADKKALSFGYWVSDEEKTQTFVVLGTDNDETRTDLILFCEYNKKANTLNVLQIPRDTKIETKSFDKKINSVYGRGGAAAVKEEIEKLLGVYPTNHIVLNFKGFRGLIDAIGGVEFDVPIRMYYTDPEQGLLIDLKPGRQILNGEKAEMFMRFRQNNDGSGYALGDIGRLSAQRSFYGALIDKLLSLNSVFDFGAAAYAIGDNLKTDFTLSDLTDNLGAIKALNKNSVKISMLKGSGKYINNISYFIVDEAAVREL